MIKGISLTASMRSNLLSLSNISTQMDKIQNILSTGKKVNSAIDNASSYYQARSLTNRASDLSSLLDAMGQGIQTIQAASEGLESATSYLEQMKSVAEQALALPDNSNTTNAPQKVPMQSKVELVDNSAELIAQGYTAIDSSMNSQDIRNLIDELGEGAKLVLTEDVEIDDGISFGGNNVTINGGGHSLKMGSSLSAYSHGFNLENIDVQFEGWGSAIGVYYGGTIKNANLSFVLDDCPYTDTQTLINASQNITIDNVNITATGYDGLVGVESYDYDIDIKNLTMDLTSTNGSVIGVRSGYGNINVDNMYIATDNDNAVGIFAEGSISGLDGYVQSGQIDGKDGFIVSVEDINNVFTQIEGGATNYDTLTVPDEPEEPAAATYSLRRSAPAQDNTSEGATAATYSLGRSAPTQEPMAIDEPVEINDAYADYIKQYEQLINEFNNLLADTSYQGVNLLTGGKLNVTFNESRTHDMTVNGKDMRTDNIGLNMKNWSSKTDIETAIKQIVDAMNEVRSFSADLGNKYTIIQTRQNFTEALTDVLETGADDLVLADMNETSAEYLMLQTRQQLAVNSLSLASQSAKSILSLF